MNVSDFIPAAVLRLFDSAARRTMGARASIFVVRGEAEIPAVAAVLARLAGEDEAEVAMDLAALLALGETTLYVQVRRWATPFDLVLAADEGHRVSYAGQGDLSASAWVDEAAPEGAYTGPFRHDLPLLHHLPQSEPCVVALGVQGGRAREETVRFPAFVTHATVAANGRTLLDRHPLGWLEGGSLCLPVR